MARFLLLPLAVLAAFPFACAKPAPAPVVGTTPPPAPTVALPSGLDESTLDKSVSPCDDFYQHACGGWLASTPIPADKASWGRGFGVLTEQTATTLRDILEAAASGKGDADNPYAKAMGDLYASCMDESTIEARGLGDIEG